MAGVIMVPSHHTLSNRPSPALKQTKPLPAAQCSSALASLLCSQRHALPSHQRSRLVPGCSVCPSPRLESKSCGPCFDLPCSLDTILSNHILTTIPHWHQCLLSADTQICRVSTLLWMLGWTPRRKGDQRFSCVRDSELCHVQKTQIHRFTTCRRVYGLGRCLGISMSEANQGSQGSGKAGSRGEIGVAQMKFLLQGASSGLLDSLSQSSTVECWHPRLDQLST